MPPTIDELIAKYFVQPNDTKLPSEPMPATFDGCLITPFIDGASYFGELSTQLAALGNGSRTENEKQFIYIAGWWLHLMGGEVKRAPGAPSDPRGPSLGLENPFSLDGPGQPTRLIDMLKKKARDGVDVRVLGWISWAVMSNGQYMRKLPSVQDINAGTLATIIELRQEPALAKKACLNTIAHTAGGAHPKIVIIGTGSSYIAFTGGIDFVGDRHSPPSGPHTTSFPWHDVQAMVEGPAVQGIYTLFGDMWNEVLDRPAKEFRFSTKTVVRNYTKDTERVPAMSLALTNVGKHRVQSLRTIPQFNYTTFNIFPENPSISFAQEGLFEARSAWHKAILAAEKYIYIEDQSFWSGEIMDWLNEAIQKHPDLKVILVRGSETDPSDPVLPPYAKIAIVNNLLKGLEPSQKERIGIFDRSFVFVHAKTTLIDDHWTMIGSTNATCRSLYSDIEHSIAVIDEDNQLVRQYRIDLWSEHFGLTSASDRAKLSDIDQALHVWKSTWGTPGNGITRPAELVMVPFPSKAPSLSEDEQRLYDLVWDPDARDDWGGCSL